MLPNTSPVRHRSQGYNYHYQLSDLLRLFQVGKIARNYQSFQDVCYPQRYFTWSSLLTRLAKRLERDSLMAKLKIDVNDLHIYGEN